MKNGLKINPNTNLGSGSQTMSSLEIAELTGKRHNNVKRDIQVMFEELELDLLNFEQVSLNHQNQEVKTYVLDEDLTTTLVSGYDANLRMRIVTEWRERKAAHEPVAVVQEINRNLLTAADVENAKCELEIQELYGIGKDEVSEALKAEMTLKHKIRMAKLEAELNTVIGVTPQTVLNTSKVMSSSQLLLIHNIHHVKCRGFFKILRANGFLDVNNKFTVKGQHFGVDYQSHLPQGKPNWYSDSFAQLLGRVGITAQQG